MTKRSFFLTNILYFAILVLIANYFNFSQYVMVCALPSLIMCLPTSFKTPRILFIAFTLGFLFDSFTHGAIGITIAALLPVALVRNTFIKLIFGEELFARKEELSFKNHGSSRLLISLLFFTALYLLTYIIIDSAGTRPFSFNLMKFICSFLCSSALSSFIVLSLTRNN